MIKQIEYSDIEWRIEINEMREMFMLTIDYPNRRVIFFIPIKGRYNNGDLYELCTNLQYYLVPHAERLAKDIIRWLNL